MDHSLIQKITNINCTVMSHCDPLPNLLINMISIANLTEGGIQILTTGNILVGMYLVYEDNNEIKESYISKHEYDNNQHKIELLDSTGQTITSSTSIFPLSIKNKKYFDGEIQVLLLKIM